MDRDEPEIIVIAPMFSFDYFYILHVILACSAFSPGKFSDLQKLLMRNYYTRK